MLKVYAKIWYNADAGYRYQIVSPHTLVWGVFILSQQKIYRVEKAD